MPNVTTDEIVNLYIDETMQSTHSYYRLSHICNRGVMDMGLDFFFSIKSVKLPVKNNKTADLPSDYLQYSKVGIANKNGQIACLKHNNSISIYADTFNDRLSKVQAGAIGFNWDYNSNNFYNFYNNGFFVGNVYGYPSDMPILGQFKIDEANNLLVLDVNYKYDYIIMEYMCSPSQDEQYTVPLVFKEALIAWLAWKDIANLPVKTHVQNSNVSMRRKEYYNQRRLAFQRYKPFRLEESVDINQEANRLTVKV